jgi:hypothetical protein
MNERDLGVDQKAAKALRIAAVAAMVALILSIVLLFKETAYTFVVFMFLGPPLILVAAVALGWVILRELKAKQVL